MASKWVQKLVVSPRKAKPSTPSSSVTLERSQKQRASLVGETIDLAEWFSSLVLSHVDPASFFNQLQSGTLLCSLCDAVRPYVALPTSLLDTMMESRTNPQYSDVKTRLARVSTFLEVARLLGVDSSSRFSVDDLELCVSTVESDISDDVFAAQKRVIACLRAVKFQLLARESAFSKEISQGIANSELSEMEPTISADQQTNQTDSLSVQHTVDQSNIVIAVEDLSHIKNDDLTHIKNDVSTDISTGPVTVSVAGSDASSDSSSKVHAPILKLMPRQRETPTRPPKRVQLTAAALKTHNRDVPVPNQFGKVDPYAEFDSVEFSDKSDAFSQHSVDEMQKLQAEEEKNERRRRIVFGVFVFTLVLLIVLISLIGKSSSSITNVVVPANSTVAPAYIPTTHSLIKFFFK